MIIPNKHNGYQAGIRRYYIGGGGGGGISFAPQADPYTSANRPNYVPYGTNGQFNQPIFQPKYENYNTGNSMNVSQYGQQPSYGGMGRNNFTPDAPLPEGMVGTMGGTGYDPVTGRSDLGTAGGSGQFTSQTMQPQQQTSMFGGQMQGGGYGQFGTNNPYSPYSNSFLNINQNANLGTNADKINTYRNSLDRGFNDQQIQNQVTGLFGQQPQGEMNYLQTQARLPVQPAQTNYGPSRAIVGRSSQMRGTPNVMRRAEGGIASLTSNIG